MRVMVLIKANSDSEAGVMPSPRLLEAMGKYNDELLRAGILLGGEGLHPSSKAKRVRFIGEKGREVADGPFAESKELVAGFWLWQVRSMEEALEWAKRIPNPDARDGEVEVRPMFEAEEFGDEFAPALREQEAQLRAQLRQR